MLSRLLGATARRVVPLLLGLAMPVLGGCGLQRPAPRVLAPLTILVHASATVNPDAHGRPAPIVVRLFELKDDEAFQAADFFALQNDDTGTLGDARLSREEWILRPDDREHLQRPVHPAATLIGVTAAYRDLGHATWRTTYRLPSAGTRDPASVLTIEVGADAIRVVPSIPSGGSSHSRGKPSR